MQRAEDENGERDENVPLFNRLRRYGLNEVERRGVCAAPARPLAGGELFSNATKPALDRGLGCVKAGDIIETGGRTLVIDNAGVAALEAQTEKFA